MIRVDIVAYDDEVATGGPLSWAQRVPTLLQELGFSVRLLLFNWGAGPRGRVFQAATAAGLPCEQFRFQNTAENTRWLLQMLRKDRPNVFIANHVLPALLISGTVRQCGIPSVGILRSDDPFYHAVIDCFLDGRSEDRLSAVVGVSQFLTELARMRFATGLAETICSGAVPPREAACWTSPFRVAYCGRFVEEQKRIGLTAATLIELTTSLSGVEGVMIGNGPDFGKVERLVRDSGAPVRLTGGLCPDAVQTELQRCHAILLLSEYEGLPTAIVEGMLTGLVPICSRMRSGTDELVIPDRTGILVDESQQTIRDVVARLSNNYELWSRLSSAAREHASEHFSVQSSVFKWRDLLTKLAALAGPAAEIPAEITKLCPPDVRTSREDDRYVHHEPILSVKWMHLFRRFLQVLGRTRS